MPYLKESHLGIERKCSSITVSSTSSLEAEVDFTVLTDLQTGMEEFSRGMSELGDRNLSPDGGLCFSIDFLQPQGAPEPPPPLITAPASGGVGSSPPAKHTRAEEVRAEVRRPEGQVWIPFLSFHSFRKTGGTIFGPPKNTHGENNRLHRDDLREAASLPATFHVNVPEYRLPQGGLVAKVCWRFRCSCSLVSAN